MSTKKDAAASKHIMISYQWGSQKQAIELRDKLKDSNYNVWMDVTHMGGDTCSSMAKAVENAEVVLMCVSQKYQASKNCKKEAEYADERDTTIIPLMMEERFRASDWLGLLMGKKLYYPIQTKAAMKESFPNLIRALGDKGRIVGKVTWTPVKHSGSKALECSICLERFKNPKTLPCLHSFCKECLLGLAPPGTRSITCPQCRKRHPVPDGDVTQFPTNFHLKELVEEEAMRQQLTGGGCEFPCTCCEVGKQSSVVGRCQDCNLYICSEGLSAHERFKAFRDHKVLVFEATTAKKQAKGPVRTTAEKKPEFELRDWDVFDAMYNEDHSTHLLMFWMQLYQGDKKWQAAMVTNYLACLEELEDGGLASEDSLAKRQLQVAHVFKQAGQYQKAIDLLEKTLDTELKEFGKRPNWLADLYQLACAIYEEMVNATLNGKIQIATLEKYIQYARKSLKIRQTLKGDDHKYELGKTLNRLSDGLRLWASQGGDDRLSETDAKTEARRHIDKAVRIFKELGTKGSLAKATRDKANLLPSFSEEQEEMYREAIALSVEAYGEYNCIAGSLYWNFHIVYQYGKSDLYGAYKWLDKCRDTYEKVYGEHHPHTQMVYEVMKRKQFVKVAKEFEARK